METILLGLSDVFTANTLLFVAFGVSIGIFVGAIPGLNSLMAIAIAIPITFYMSPLPAIAFLVGVNKGGTYGGSISAVLLNTPGSPEAAATAFDGYPLTQQGKAQKALKMALYSSVFGDTFSDIVLILIAAPIALIALRMGPPEMTAVLLFAFTMIAGLVGRSLYKGVIAAALGIVVSSIGLDPITATPRLTFGFIELQDGIPLLTMAIGLLALTEVIVQFEQRGKTTANAMAALKSGSKEDRSLSRQEFCSCLRTLLRSSIIGTGCGAMPGIGASVTPFLGYSAAKRASTDPNKFGTGAIEGIAASEAANSAVVGANLIPLLTLGIPGSATAALLIGAFLIHGIVPGPTMFEQHGRLIYGLFGAMLIANFCTLIIGSFGLRIFAAVLNLPRYVIFPVVVILCLAGAYLADNSMFSVFLAIVFAVLGYIMRKLEFPYVTFIIGFILGPLFENTLSQSLILSGNDLTIFLTRPISLGFVLLSAFSLWRFSTRAAERTASPTA